MIDITITGERATVHVHFHGVDLASLHPSLQAITTQLHRMSQQIEELNAKLDAAAAAATAEREETQAAFAALNTIIAELRAGADLTASLAKADTVIASIQGIYTAPVVEPPVEPAAVS